MRDRGSGLLVPVHLFAAFVHFLGFQAQCGDRAGIEAGNAAGVIAAGADGIAVISALFMAEDVAEEARRLRGIVNRALAARSGRRWPATTVK